MDRRSFIRKAGATGAGALQGSALHGTAAASATPKAAAAAAAAPAEQLGVHIQRAVRDGNTRITVQLNPVDLGQVDVHLDFARDGRVSATILADRADTLDMLQRDARLLECVAVIRALLAGESEHGVTWHLMTDAVDCGDVLAREAITIEDGETSLSLNTKCFEAGPNSFTALARGYVDGPSGAVAAQLLVIRPGEDGYDVRHALLREVIDADLLPGERARLHATYAQALTEQPELADASPAVGRSWRSASACR